MATWFVPVVTVVVLALMILFLLSFDTLEYQEMGLCYNWVMETVLPGPFQSGRYYLGIGNHFIKFPKMVKSIYLIDPNQAGGWSNYGSNRMTGSYQGPLLQSRTLDGLNVQLEVSFQYRLKFESLYQLYTTLGLEYEDTLVRMAIEQLAASTTHHSATYFFTNRTMISVEMHKELATHFEKHAFSEVPFFQLRTVHLPSDFEDAIMTTQVKQQEIQIATLQQKKDTVGFETTVLQAEQQVKVIMNQAEAKVAAIMATNDAYCRQFKLNAELQATAYSALKGKAGWSPEQLLEYLRIRAVREHPSDLTTIRLKH